MRPTHADLLVRVSLAGIVAALLLPAVVDVDLWGHVMFGRDIVAGTAIPEFDHYAFTSDLPWIDHEWLTEVIMYGAYAAHPGAGLVALRAVLILALLGIVWYDLRREGVSPRAALTLVTALALLTYPRNQHVRPHLFSLVAFAVLLVLLKAAARGRTSALFGVPPLMALWANLHGGFVVAFLPMGLWSLRAVFDFGRTSRQRALVPAILGASVLATLANPYGIDLWRFLLRTVGPNRGDITEWAPVTHLGGAVLVFWSVTAVLAAAAIWREARTASRGFDRIEQVLLVVLLAAASFRVNRLDAFFAIALMMCLGRPLASLLARERPADAHVRPRRLVAGTALAVVVAAAGCDLVRTGPARSTCIDMTSSDWLPEREAAAFIDRHDLRGRMVVFFDWGEYALWHFSPGLEVSTDGRRETIYSNRHIQGHLELYAGSAAGLAYLRELNADYVWLPKGLAVVNRLPAEGWSELYSGERAVIFGRTPLAPLPGPSQMAPGPRCFPGP